MFGKLKSFEDKKTPINEKKLAPSPQNFPPIKKKIHKNKSNDVNARINDNLQGSKFRMINEYFYTNDSVKTFDYFQTHKQDFKTYHEGFQNQIHKWPQKPIQSIIKMLETNEKFYNKEIIDLGCGEGILYEYFYKRQQILSPHDGKIIENNKKKEKNTPFFKKISCFDLISLKDFITIADIRKLPLINKSTDIAIFCLALMGTNYLEFLLEASRCLRTSGYLIVCEVVSRMPYPEWFCCMIENLGYHLEEKVQNNNYFVILLFKKYRDFNVKPQQKIKDIKAFNKIWGSDLQNQLYNNITLSELSILLLKPCIYKKR